MSDLRVSSVKTRTGDSPRLPDGVVVTGVTTTTTFKGNLSGNVTGNVAGIATGNITGNISGTTGSFSGDVSVGGTITYEDVTSIDSVGVITAKAGIKVGAGQSISPVSGIVTYYGDGSQLTGVESGVVNFVASGFIDNGKTVIINTDGTVGIVTVNGSTNLTSENYIGIAAEAIADGATGKINVVGGINQGQTGLTTGKTYYVQNNGTLSTSAGSPSVVAGNSISSTKIIVS
jgi:hypothetical protein